MLMVSSGLLSTFIPPPFGIAVELAAMLISVVVPCLDKQPAIALSHRGPWAIEIVERSQGVKGFQVLRGARRSNALGSDDSKVLLQPTPGF